MKILGLIGGTSWVSTQDYYRNLNRGIQEALGGVASAELILYSVNFQEFKDRFERDDWEGVCQQLITIARKLEISGATAIVLCANTPHRVAPEIRAKINIPLLHIVDAVGEKILEKGLIKVGLLGTRSTMEFGFYQEILGKLGIEVLIPDQLDCDFLDHNIYEELTRDVFTQESREKYKEIIDKLKEQGIEGIIYGCTEIPILLKDWDSGIPIFDTLKIHCDSIIHFALGD